MKKRKGLEKKKKKHINKLPILVLVLSLFISIGFSAFQETMLIGETVVDIVPVVNARLTSLSPYSSYNGGMLGSLEYDEDTITGEVTLPSSDSTATMLLEVTNLENAEAGIYDIDITSDNDKLEYTIEPGYAKKQKICDDSNSNKCTLGATKSIYLTLSVDSTKYDSNDITDNFELDMDFEGYYSIIYIDINGTYQDEIIGNDTLEVDFTNNAPYDVSVSMGGLTLTSGYTYLNGVLTIDSVTGNTVITSVNRAEGCFLVEALEDPTKGKIVAYDTDCGLNVTIPATAHTSTIQGDFDMPTCLLSNTQQVCNNYQTIWNNKNAGFMNIKRAGLVPNFDIIETNTTVAIQEIGDYAFNIPITGLNLSQATNLTTIGSGGFIGARLTTLTIPSSITTIGDHAFSNNFLTSLDLSSAINLTTIEDSVFSFNLLTNVIFNNSITSIGLNAFECNRLESITIPNSVASIGESAFKSNKLDEVYIGSGITSIGSSAFASTTPQYDNTHDYTYESNAITRVVIERSSNGVNVASNSFSGFNGTICWLGDNPTCNSN